MSDSFAVSDLWTQINAELADLFRTYPKIASAAVPHSGYFPRQRGRRLEHIIRIETIGTC